MAYPASEVIANTIAEAINNADKMSGWDYVYTISTTITALVTLGILFWEIKKSREERKRIRSIATLQKIEKQHLKILSFLFESDLPNNNRILWGKAYLELQKLHSIYLIETNEIREEAKTERDAFIGQLKFILIDGDPEMQSLRWQFFTGIDNWQTNHDTWNEIKSKVNIGSAYSQPDNFGNYSKKDGIHSISPYHVLAIYDFTYTGRCPEINTIELPSVKNIPKNKKELIRQIKINGDSPKWLAPSEEELNGLIHYLFEFYQQSNT